MTAKGKESPNPMMLDKVSISYIPGKGQKYTEATLEYQYEAPWKNSYVVMKEPDGKQLMRVNCNSLVDDRHLTITARIILAKMGMPTSDMTQEATDGIKKLLEMLARW